MSTSIGDSIKCKILLDKRLSGIYYTPRPISQTIVDWAVRGSKDRILEPSFGGCVFLQSAIRRLKQFGVAQPAPLLFGSDQDPKAFTFLREMEGHRDRNFVQGDFIGLSLNNFGGRKFDAIVGNPPYVSLHNMSKKQREAVVALSLTASLKLDHKASLWAYFVAHSVSFLKKDGRLGFVLPSSLLNSIYGKQLLTGLETIFRRCAVISIAEQCFLSQKAKEKVVIFLADGAFHGQGAIKTQIWGVQGVSDVQETLVKWENQCLRVQNINGHVVPQLLSIRCNNLSHDIENSPDMEALGDVATIKIGVVTGANHFFVLKPSEAARLKLPKHLLTYILSKFAVCPGMYLQENDFLAANANGMRTLLFSCSETEDDAAALEYLSTFPIQDRLQNKTFGKRSCWSRPEVGVRPDAFLTYMVKDGPRIVLNSCSTNSTNTIHRVYFKPGATNSERQLTALLLLSSYAQLSAEFECRTYGSGVLKIEPSEAAKIRIPKLPKMPSKQAVTFLSKVDALMRAGQRQKAVDAVDALVAKKLPCLASSLSLSEVRKAISEARARRSCKLPVQSVEKV